MAGGETGTRSFSLKHRLWQAFSASAEAHPAALAERLAAIHHPADRIAGPTSAMARRTRSGAGMIVQGEGCRGVPRAARPDLGPPRRTISVRPRDGDERSPCRIPTADTGAGRGHRFFPFNINHLWHIIDVMLQARFPPLAPSLGTEGMQPGPIVGDGPALAEGRSRAIRGEPCAGQGDAPDARRPPRRDGPRPRRLTLSRVEQGGRPSGRASPASEPTARRRPAIPRRCGRSCSGSGSCP